MNLKQQIVTNLLSIALPIILAVTGLFSYNVHQIGRVEDRLDARLNRLEEKLEANRLEVKADMGDANKQMNGRFDKIETLLVPSSIKK